jgi:E3 ubiquitin-protein ligase MARCH6
MPRLSGAGRSRVSHHDSELCWIGFCCYLTTKFQSPILSRRPLFKPCICSGSIGLTHQDCLQSWLQVQRGDGSCELCKTKFRFAPLYAPNTPSKLPARAVISGLSRRAIAKWLPFIIRSLFAASLWLFVAPLLTAYLYHGWMARPTIILDRVMSRQMIVTDLISGGVVASCIIVSFLSLMSFADFLRLEWQQRGGFIGRPLNNRQPNQRHGQAAAAEAVEVEDNVFDDMNIDDSFWNQVLQHTATIGGSDGTEGQSDSFEISDNEHIFDDDDDDDEDYESNDESEGADSWESTIYGDDEDNGNISLSDEDVDIEPPIHENAQDVGPLDIVGAEDEAVGAAIGEGIEHQNRQENPGPLPDRRARQGQRNDAFDMVDQDEPIDMDINIALDELLGIRGPLIVVVRNLLWLLAFNAVYLGFFAFVPRTIGIAIGSTAFNTTAFFNSSTIHGENFTEVIPQLNTTENVSFIKIWNSIEAESIRQNTAFRLHDIAAVAFGYFSLAAAIFIFRFLWLFSGKIQSLRSGNEQRENRPNAEDLQEAFDEMNRIVQGLGNDAPQLGDQPDVAVGLALGVALDVTVAIVKVGALLCLKMFLLPIILGIALDASTMVLFGSTLEDRVLYAGQDIFSFILLHWVAGITFMLLVTVSVLQLREVAHPDLFAQMIRPQEPQPDLLGNLMYESVTTHTKRMVLSLIIYAFLLSIHIYLPVRYGVSNLIDDRIKKHLQLKFYYILPPQLQVPIELLFFHLCMLALLEKYKNSLGGMQHHWLKVMSRTMGLSDRMLPHTIAYFRSVGSRPVFQSGRSIDPFWYELLDGKKEAMMDLKSKFKALDEVIYSRGEAKPNGTRFLSRCADYIRLPGKDCNSHSVLLPSKAGHYLLKRDKLCKAIELWEEVPGEAILRPPEGWDDLGVGGADVQGRWAWGSEKKSKIENGVAARRPFFEKRQGFAESFKVLLKLLALASLSWLAASVVLCIVAGTPLAIGRSLYFILRIPNRWVHDPLAFGLGFTIMFPFVRKTAKVVVSSDRPIHQRLRQWIGRFRKPPLNKALVLVATAFLWFGFAPLLLGLSYDLAFIKSVDWFNGKEPFCDLKSSLWNWMGGTVLLYVWADLCILGVLTRNYRAFVLDVQAPVNEKDDASDDNATKRGLSWQGKHGRMARFWGIWKSIFQGWEWDQVDEVLLLHECAAPIVVELSYTLIFPLLVYALCLIRFPLLSGFTRAVCVRSILALTCCIRVGRAWKDQLRRFFDVAHKTARDDLYLIGEILMNFGDT